MQTGSNLASGAQSIIIVKSLCLRKTFRNKSDLTSITRFIWCPFDLDNPLMLDEFLAVVKSTNLNVTFL